MSAALGAAFQEGAEKAILIGSDYPSLRAELLEQAFSDLDQSEVVLGPTYDGGYYLIGMRRWLPQLFDGIAWSTETVLSATLQRVEAIGVTCSLLEQLRDIDEEADWRAFL
jgi:rSAM/selenodomain-associated transferase 1